MNVERFLFLALLHFCFVLPGQASESIERYRGEARGKNGELIYIEKHEVVLLNGRVSKATTQYFDDRDKLIGILSSDFSKSLTSPEYVFEDKRHGDFHGIRIKDGQLFMFNREDGKEESRALDQATNSNELFVGCQGLHYYLRDHMDSVRAQRNLPVKFLIPGNLDYYNFIMNYEEESKDGAVDFEIKIENWFLRLFAPSLNVTYDPKTGRLVRYKGLSNIKNARGKLQNVEITYFYNDA